MTPGPNGASHQLHADLCSFLHVIDLIMAIPDIKFAYAYVCVHLITLAKSLPYRYVVIHP